MKLVNQLKCAVITLLLFAIFNLGFVSVQIDQMTMDSRVVNFAGIIRGGTQRAIKLEIANQPDPDLLLNLDQILDGLINGSQPLQLPKATDPGFLRAMQFTEAAWLELKSLLQKPKLKDQTRYQQELLQASEEYWQLTNAAVFAAEAFAKVHIDQLKQIQGIIFVLNLSLLAFMGWIIAGSIQQRLIATIHHLNSSATELAITVEEQERAATQQAAAVQETTCTIDELGTLSHSTAAEAQTTVISAQKILPLIQASTASTDQALAEMVRLQSQVRVMQEQILHLNTQLAQINQISTFVSDLAHETHFLALNVAVETSRRGENRQGLGVIAAEIRRLAHQSKQSARVIIGLIAEIKMTIQATTVVFQASMEIVEVNVQKTQETASRLSKIEEVIQQMVINNQNISLINHQQAAAIQQVMDAMTCLNQAAAKTSVGISHITISMQQLSQASLDLKAVL